MKENLEISRPNDWEDKEHKNEGPNKGLTNLQIEKKEKRHHRKEDIESVAEWILNRTLSQGGTYSEKIPLRADGGINIESTSEVERSMIVQYAKTLDTVSTDDLHDLAIEIQKEYPDIFLSIKPDRANAWIEVVARVKVEKLVRVGDLVNWENNNAIMWPEPKNIVRIDSMDGKKFAFFEGSPTGIPVEQLFPVKE